MGISKYNLKDKCAIVGVGYTPQGKLPERTIRSLYHEACLNAIADAGLTVKAIDGIMVQKCWQDFLPHPLGTSAWTLQQDLGIESLRWSADYDAMGASANAMVQVAAMAIDAGMINYMLLAFVEHGGSPPPELLLQVLPMYTMSVPPEKRAQLISALAPMTGLVYQGGIGPNIVYGHFSAMGGIGLSAQLHMNKYGTTSRQFGEVAVACRKHACLNPRAMMRTPITIEDHQNSRMVAAPFRLLDCCLTSDAGRAVIVTSAERAKDLKKPPVYIMGMGQGYVIIDPMFRADILNTGTGVSGKTAFEMAGITQKDIDFAEIYDATTYSVITQLEELGFCKRGEGGAFVEGGRIQLGGELPVNTSGGLLSEVYAQGWTGLCEAVSQLRNECGERQVKNAEIGLVTNQGGITTEHSTLILRR